MHLLVWASSAKAVAYLAELVRSLLQLQACRLRLLRRRREPQVLGQLGEGVVNQHAPHRVVQDVIEPLLHLHGEAEAEEEVVEEEEVAERRRRWSRRRRRRWR